jgi:cellobiose PTS system EIIB component
LKKKLASDAEKVGIPLDVIDPVDYGRIDGEAVLNKALELIGEN